MNYYTYCIGGFRELLRLHTGEVQFTKFVFLLQLKLLVKT